MIHENEAVKVTGPELRYLADPASDRVLVTLTTGLSVINGSEAVSDLLYTGELLLGHIHFRLSNEPVRVVVKASWGFCGRLTLDGARKSKWHHERRRE